MIAETGFGNLSDADLAKKLADKTAEVSKESKKTIIDKFNQGKLVTAAQLKEIANLPGVRAAVKSLPVKVPKTDKKSGEVTIEIVTKFYNKKVTRLNEAITAGTVVDEESILNANRLDAESRAHQNSIMVDVNHGRGEIAAMRAEVAQREANSAAKAIADKKLRMLNYDQIYSNAVAAKKLTGNDQQDAEAEGDDVPTHSATTAVREVATAPTTQ